MDILNNDIIAVLSKEDSYRAHRGIPLESEQTPRMAYHISHKKIVAVWDIPTVPFETIDKAKGHFDAHRKTIIEYVDDDGVIYCLKTNSFPADYLAQVQQDSDGMTYKCWAGFITNRHYEACVPDDMRCFERLREVHEFLKRDEHETE